VRVFCAVCDGAERERAMQGAPNRVRERLARGGRTGAVVPSSDPPGTCVGRRCVAALLAAHADMERCEAKLGRTALHLATSEGHAAVVKQLLTAGADYRATFSKLKVRCVCAPSPHGRTPSRARVSSSSPWRAGLSHLLSFSSNPRMRSLG
jgi:hypothetical protein